MLVSRLQASTVSFYGIARVKLTTAGAEEINCSLRHICVNSPIHLLVGPGPWFVLGVSWLCDTWHLCFPSSCQPACASSQQACQDLHDYTPYMMSAETQNHTAVLAHTDRHAGARTSSLGAYLNAINVIACIGNV